MFAKETFDYPELEEHPLLCNHLGNIKQTVKLSFTRVSPFIFSPETEGATAEKEEVEGGDGCPQQSGRFRARVQQLGGVQLFCH